MECSEKFNIIYLHSHDTGRYIQPYGYAMDTPHLQGLAEGGVLFRDMHCAAPTCSPSRAALLTGQAPHNSGMLGLAHRGFSLVDNTHLLGHVLSQHGYETVLAGLQHLHKNQREKLYSLGYHHVRHGQNDDDLTTQYAIDYLRNNPKAPFFLDVGFNRTHRQGEGFSQDDAPRPNPDYTQPPAVLPDNAQTRADMADFMHSAKGLDNRIGEILQALDQTGLREKTIVIYTTDHGIAFPGMKCNLTSHGTGVAFIINRAGIFPEGKVIDALASQIDIFPTLCEVLAIPKPDWLQGESLLPVIIQGKERRNDAVFAEVTYHAAYEPQRAIRTKRYTYIRRFGSYPYTVQGNIDDSPSKSLWAEQGLATRKPEQEMLFDHLFDPQECRNLIDHPEYQEILQTLQKRLNQWMQETNDPLLKGDVPPPVGAVLTPQDAYHPEDLQ